MTRDQVVALAEGKDDVDLYAVGRIYGLLPLACAFDGLDPATPHKSDEFSRENPFVHLAIREGCVEPVLKDISGQKKFQGQVVHDSMGVLGETLPIHHTVFRGE